MDLFQKPLYLLWALLFLAGAGALYAWSEARRSRLLAAFGLPATLSRLFPQEALARRRRRYALQTAGATLLFVALAGPQWGVELVTNEARGIQALIAVDTSLSMLAEDVKPNRMEKAKSEMLEILNGLKGQRVGIIAFAGEPHVHCPLTTDIDAAKSMLGYLKVGMIPQPGTAIGEAVRTATRILGRYPGHKALVLLTDGEDRRGDPMDAVRQASSAGIHIYIVGVGTPDGDPIPVKDPDGRTIAYVKDAKGATVISKLGEAESIRIAAAASGAYYRATPEETEAAEILKQIQGLEKSRIETASSTRYRNRFRLPAALAFLLLMVELLLPDRPRRPQALPTERNASPRSENPSRAAPLAACLALFLAGCGQGSLAYDLWRGNREYGKEDYGKSLERYESAGRRRPGDPRPVFNAGDSKYKLGQYDDAKEAFSSVAGPEKNPAPLRGRAYYNLGNAQYQKKEYKDAVESYKQCLLLDPSDEDCRFNLLKALQMSREQQQKKKQQKQQPKQDQKKQDQPRQKKNDEEDKKQKPNPDKARPQSEMSQEDAERILQSVREKEKGTVRPKPSWEKKPPQGGGGQQEVDW